VIERDVCSVGVYENNKNNIMKHAACSLFVFCSFLFMLLMLLIRDSDCVASKLTDDLSTLTVISVSELPARRAC
jgi:hypothetical protein